MIDANLEVKEPTQEEVNKHVNEENARAHRYESGVRAYSAMDLITLAKDKPPVAIIDGLLYEKDILLLHAPEESFKSIFVLQIAEAIALGRPLLRQWPIRARQRVGIIETEMHPAMLGDRLNKMFPGNDPPDNLFFLSEDPLKEWRRENLEGKFEIIQRWLSENHIQVLMIDTANDFFRGQENPSDERFVGKFFDLLRNLPLSATVLVRHDRKKKDIDSDSHSNELIRGSAEWKEDPEAILSIQRTDKRTNEVSLDVGKLRYGRKPAPIEAWFDSDRFRLTPLPPVIAIIESGEKTRQQVLEECARRFGVEDRIADAMLAEQRQYLLEGRAGHNITFRLHPTASADAPWASFLTCPRC